MSLKDKIKGKKRKNFNKEAIKKSFNKKYLKNGSYSVIISTVFVAIVLVINLIVSEIPSKYTEIDVSSNKLYSIGDDTKEMLDALDVDVSIYQVAQSESEDETIKNLLQKYEDESDHVTVEQKDPIVNPSFVSEYTSENISSNSLIVVSGDRSKVVDYSDMYETSIDYYTYSYETTGFDGEGQISSAIAYVTSDNLPVLYTLEGHGEMELSSTIKEDIEKANMEIKTLNLLTEGSVPEDADCLMILSPLTDISEDEKDAVLEYLENGGKAMIFSDYTEDSLENFDAVLANYGVERAEGIVFEENTQYYAMQTPYYIVPDVNSAEAISGFASQGYYVLAPYAQGIQRTADVRDTVTIESLLSTSEDSFSKVNLNGDTFEKVEEDIDGPFDLGVSITENVDDEKQTQIIYYSTGNILDDSVNQMVSGGNEQMVMEAFEWLCGSEETTTISIPSKSIEVSYLTLTAYDVSFWQICTIALIPGVFLVYGFVVWFRRRKA